MWCLFAVTRRSRFCAAVALGEQRNCAALSTGVSTGRPRALVFRVCGALKAFDVMQMVH